jgi:hypothetical protein
MLSKSTLTAAFFFVLTALGCVAPAHADADCNKLPPEVADYLRANSGWKIVQFSDLVSDDQALWNQYSRGQCPGMTLVDFDGSGKKFHALALLQRSNGQLLEKVVVFRLSKRGLEEHILSEAGPASRADVIYRVGPGKTHEWDNSKEFLVPHDSLIYEHMESAARQYYYSRGKFRYVQTSD